MSEDKKKESKEIDYYEETNKILIKALDDNTKIITRLISLVAAERLRFEALVAILENNNILDNDEYQNQINELLDKFEPGELARLLIEELFEEKDKDKKGGEL